MLAKRIIPCLDVKEGKVVKGLQFKNHRVVGEIEEFVARYAATGADEVVFYDITASCERRVLDHNWIDRVAKCLDIPFCVAGGISTLKEAEIILNKGADKISINSPALADPRLIDSLVAEFGSQCIVVGIDSLHCDGQYQVCQYTGDESKSRRLDRLTQEWITEVQARGAGEIVLNCMNNDGVRKGYDVIQLNIMREFSSVPLIASGGAGKLADFLDVFVVSNVDGALAASVFHSNEIDITMLKKYLYKKGVSVRP